MTHEMHKPHMRYAFSCIFLTNCLTSTCTFCAQNFAYNVIPQGFVILLLSLFLLQFLQIQFKGKLRVCWGTRTITNNDEILLITVAQSVVFFILAMFLCTWYFQINDNLPNWQCYKLILSRFTFLSTGSFLNVYFTEKCHPQTILNDLRNTTIFVGVLFCGSKSYSKLSEGVPNFSTTHKQKTPHYDNTMHYLQDGFPR